MNWEPLQCEAVLNSAFREVVERKSSYAKIHWEKNRNFGYDSVLHNFNYLCAFALSASFLCREYGDAACVKAGCKTL